jgi:hypothetical protein
VIAITACYQLLDATRFYQVSHNNPSNFNTSPAQNGDWKTFFFAHPLLSTTIHTLMHVFRRQSLLNHAAIHTIARQRVSTPPVHAAPVFPLL